MKKKIGKMRGVLLLTFALFLTACGTGGADAQSASYGNSQAAVVERQSGSGENESTAGSSQDPVSATLDNIPAYSGTPYVVIDDNEPDFTEDELTDQSYESYSDLDELGRCGVAASNIGTDLMPTGKRGKIGQVKPSGWQTIKFDNVDGKYLYNRCHLIGYQLTADKLFKEVFKAKEEVCREIGTGKKIQDAGRLEDEKMWKVDRNFLEKAEEEDFCFVEGENLAGYEGKITEIVLYKWNRDYPADVFFEVDLSKWRLEERKDFSGYSHEKITKEIYNRQGLL